MLSVTISFPSKTICKSTQPLKTLQLNCTLKVKEELKLNHCALIENKHKNVIDNNIYLIKGLRPILAQRKQDKLQYSKTAFF